MRHICFATIGPVAQWIRHRPTEPGIAGSSRAGVIHHFCCNQNKHSFLPSGWTTRCSGSFLMASCLVFANEGGQVLPSITQNLLSKRKSAHRDSNRRPANLQSAELTIALRCPTEGGSLEGRSPPTLGVPLLQGGALPTGGGRECVCLCLLVVPCICLHSISSFCSFAIHAIHASWKINSGKSWKRDLRTDSTACQKNDGF